MSSDRNNSKPADRSIFRKNIGRALLNKNKDPYLKIWEIDFLPKANRDKYGDLRDKKKKNLLKSGLQKYLEIISFLGL